MPKIEPEEPSHDFIWDLFRGFRAMPGEVDDPDPDIADDALWDFSGELAEHLWALAFRAGIQHAAGHGAHFYLSTGCHHGEHGYCRSKYGMSGLKKAATCKFCDQKCICDCHKEDGNRD